MRKEEQTIKKMGSFYDWVHPPSWLSIRQSLEVTFSLLNSDMKHWNYMLLTALTSLLSRNLTNQNET